MIPLPLLGFLILAAGAVHAPPPNGGADPSEGFVTTHDGVRLWYRKIGAGAPSLLVPNATYLMDDFAALAEGRTVVFYDLRARGRSQAIDDPELLRGGIENDVADLETVRRHFGADRVSVLGHSYLGLAAALWASEHPDRLDRLVQIGPLGPFPGKEYPPELRARDPEPVPSPEVVEELQHRRAAREWESDPEEYCRFWWSVIARMMVSEERLVDRVVTPCDLPNEAPQRFEALFGEHVAPSFQRLDLTPERWRAVRRPVLVVHGTRDRNAPYGGGVDWASLWPEARLLTVEGAAHLPWIEEPDVVPAINRFLSGEWPEDASATGG